MVGFPPSITAAAEFEVPRSIPIILAMLLILLGFFVPVCFGFHGNAYSAGSNQPVVPHVPSLDFFQNCSFVLIGPFLLSHGLVPMRIQLMSDGLYRDQTLVPKKFLKMLMDEVQTLFNRLQIGGVFRG